MKRIIRKLVRSKKAQSMVEMAIMLPVLLLLLIGIIDFGRILGGYMIMHDLARDGVRYGVVGKSDTFIKEYIANNAAEWKITIDKTNQEQLRIKPTPDPREIGGELKVTIKHSFDLLTPFIGGIFPEGKWPLTAEYVMRIEQLPQP